MARKLKKEQEEQSFPETVSAIKTDTEKGALHHERFAIHISLSGKTILVSLSAILLGLLVLLGIQLYLNNKIYPGVTIANISVGATTPAQALINVQEQLDRRFNTPLTFTTDQGKTSFTLTLSKDAISTNDKETIQNAWHYGRDRAYVPIVNVPLQITLGKAITDQIATISAQVDQPALNAQLKQVDNQIEVTPSQNGTVLDQQELAKRIITYIDTGKKPTSDLPFKSEKPQLTYQSALLIKKRLDQIQATPISLTYQDKTFPLDLQTVLTFLDFETNNQTNLISGSFETQTLTLNKPNIEKFLQTITPQINVAAKESRFAYDSTQPNNVRELTTSQDGRALNIDKSVTAITQAIETNDMQTVALPVDTVQSINPTANDLGINIVIGHGQSNFTGSIPNRVYNIQLGASRINGAMIKPGEVFSFDDTVGDISGASGYKPGYIISHGRTVLDDGGGICQVSTTVYRAALNAGLPIVARTAHAYRVHYYEEDSGPGLDATIFSPTVDLQFKNDTPANILIQAYVKGNQLFVDFYGTSDGRVTKISKPVVLNQTPPPAPLYQDDPTLPQGTTKQVDFAAWGANVEFTRTVVRNGQTLINETVHSNYRPWQAVYLVGTKTS